MIERLRQLAEGPRGDGVAAFSALYLRVTEGVDEGLGATTFEEPNFVTQLDITFANLFFDALDAYMRNPASAPHAWVPLFEQRSRRRIEPLQFALAGMNAHINRDLPVAVVSTCTALRVELLRESREHADFERVNTLLAAVEANVRRAYLTGWVAFVDRLLHPFGHLDDVLAIWSVESARDAAWANAETLWSLRNEPALAGAFLETLDKTIGFAGRGLLVPTVSWLPVVRRRVGSGLAR
ncbi:MAG TPA: DUF5995 family protein [Gaiellaceae bacterium]|nr:DUF5995 family protein [Gaiellaceae bacterium]